MLQLCLRKTLEDPHWISLSSTNVWFGLYIMQLVKGLGGSGLAMPVEVVQFCWKYNAERLKNLPEVAGCEVH